MNRATEVDHLEVPRQYPNSPAKRNADISRNLGLIVTTTSRIAENLLVHPFLSLRRQCQVNYTAKWTHITPISLFPVMYNIQRHQGPSTLWKGFLSKYLPIGVSMFSDSLLDQFTPLSREVTTRSPTKKIVGHLVLKSIGFLAMTPFYSAALMDTVQSYVAGNEGSILSTLHEAMSRLLGWKINFKTRLFPVWKLLIPTLAYFLLNYAIQSLAKVFSYQILIIKEKEKSKISPALATDETVDKDGPRYQYIQCMSSLVGCCVADAICFPIETILNRLHLQGTRTIIDNTDNGLSVLPINTRYEGFYDCFTSICESEGFLGLYKGLGALILQYGVLYLVLKGTVLILQRVEESATRSNSNSPRKSV